MPAAEVAAAASAGRDAARSAKRKRGASPLEAPEGHLVEAKVIVYLAEAYRYARLRKIGKVTELVKCTWRRSDNSSHYSAGGCAMRGGGRTTKY